MAYFMSGYLAHAGLLCSKEFQHMNVEKNISRSVQISGQDLHICPPDKGKMENFHQTLHAAE